MYLHFLAEQSVSLSHPLPPWAMVTGGLLMLCLMATVRALVTASRDQRRAMMPLVLVKKSLPPNTAMSLHQSPGRIEVMKGPIPRELQLVGGRRDGLVYPFFGPRIKLATSSKYSTIDWNDPAQKIQEIGVSADEYVLVWSSLSGEWVYLHEPLLFRHERDGRGVWEQK